MRAATQIGLADTSLPCSHRFVHNNQGKRLLGVFTETPSRRLKTQRMAAMRMVELPWANIDTYGAREQG
jgi:hypothetical protein